MGRMDRLVALSCQDPVGTLVYTEQIAGSWDVDPLAMWLGMSQNSGSS